MRSREVFRCGKGSRGREPHLWTTVLAFLCSAYMAAGADLNPGITFTDGQRIYASQLQQLVGSATILPGFYSDSSKALATSLATSDSLLVLSGGSLKRITATTFLYGNTALITDRTEETAPAGNDYLLIYDTSGTLLKKVSVQTLTFGQTNIITANSNVTSLLPSAAFLIYQGGTNGQVALSNIFLAFNYSASFTNLALHTAPTNDDRLLIFDSLAGTNKQTTLAGLVTNLTPVVTTNENDVLFAYSAASNLVMKLPLSKLAAWLTNAAGILPASSRFQSFDYPISSGLYITTNHGFSAAPMIVRGVYVCTTANNNYAVGDQLDYASVNNVLSQDTQTAAVGANATNVFFNIESSSGSLAYHNKTTGADVTETLVTFAGNWKIRLYASP